MKQVTLNVADEVAALGDGIKAEVADFKAKKGMSVEISDALPMLIAMAGGYAALPADIKQSDDIAYLCKDIAQAFGLA